jgi:hypothetical protein
MWKEFLSVFLRLPFTENLKCFMLGKQFVSLTNSMELSPSLDAKSRLDIKENPNTMESQGSLPRSQESAPGLCSKLDQSSPYHSFLFL